MLTASAPAPDCKLPALHGPETALSALWQAGPVLLVFFKVSCPTCQFTFPYLERIHQGRRGPKIVAVSQDNAANTALFRREFGITIPALLDPPPRYEASNAYGISIVPSLFLIDTGGRIAWGGEGFDRARLTELGRQAGVETFAPGDPAPAQRPG